MKRNTGDGLDSSSFRKRERPGSSPLKPHLPTRKGKEKAGGNENVWQVLSKFEDELTCPM